MMEYWVWRTAICFYKDGMDQKIKSDHDPLLNRYIQYSIFLSDP